jgi:hypothetical protein
LWGATSVLQTFFTGISPKAIPLPELINLTRKAHKVRKYPGDEGFERSGGAVSRYDRTPSKIGGAKPGHRVSAVRVGDDGKAIKSSRRYFRVVGSFADLCEWAKDAALDSMILYSSSGAPYNISVE